MTPQLLLMRSLQTGRTSSRHAIACTAAQGKLRSNLVHSDPRRLSWFRQALVKAAVKTQVIVLTCRPQDYLSDAEVPQASASLDLAGGAIRAVDLARVMMRYRDSGAQAVPESNVERIERARAS